MDTTPGYEVGRELEYLFIPSEVGNQGASWVFEAWVSVVAVFYVVFGWCRATIVLLFGLVLFLPCHLPLS